MDFSLTDDHLALRDAVQRFCDGEYPAHERGNPETAERAKQRHAGMAELGLLGLSLDTELGGSAQGSVELMLVAQELGRALANGAWLSNAVLAGPLLAEAGTPAQRLQWLRPMAEGSLQIALACAEDQARYELADVRTRARRDGQEWVLDGRKTMVLGGDSAQLLLIVARSQGAQLETEGLTLFAVEAGSAGLRVQPFGLLDGRRAAHVELQGVRVDDARRIGAVGGALPFIERAVARANAALCAEAAGALDALLALTCEHLRTRKQFGAPLSRFQALQHRVADMALALEQLKSMACIAAMALQGATDVERERLVSAAKSLVSRLGRECALVAIQLHGAMGMTDECRAGHYAKRLLAMGPLFGDSSHHLLRFAALNRAARC